MAGDLAERLSEVLDATEGCDVLGDDLERALKHAGLDLCTAAERKVLEACQAIPDESLREWRKHVRASAARDLWDAELDRRGGTELPHGIPEGENDKGWPDGTPESVKKGLRNG